MSAAGASMTGPGARTAPSILVRSLRARDVAILALSGLSPAASVYVTGSAILRMAGTGAAVAIVAGALIQLLASLLYAELASAFPSSGGVYPGVSAVLGRSAGFTVVALALVTSPAFLAFVALGLADYLRVLQPAAPKLPLALAALCAAMFTALLAIRTNAWITGLFLVAEMVGLLLLLVAGMHPVRGLGEVLLHPVLASGGRAVAPVPAATLALAVVSGSFACSGASLAINFADEMNGEPRRIGWVVATVGVIAALVVSAPVVLVTLGARNLPQVLRSEAPMATFLTASLGSLMARVAAATVAVAIMNNLIAALLAFGRLFHATGRDHIWPASAAAPLARLHPRFRSPWVTTAGLTVAAAGLCLAGPKILLVLLSGEVFTATFVVAAVIVGRRDRRTPRSSFRSPFFPLAPVAGAAVILGIVAADWADPAVGRVSLLILATTACAAWSLHRLWPRRPSSRGAVG